MTNPTPRQAGYRYLGFTTQGHALQDKTTGNVELWVKNKGHASFGLRFKGTDLEFLRTLAPSEKDRLLG